MIYPSNSIVVDVLMTIVQVKHKEIVEATGNIMYEKLPRLVYEHGEEKKVT